MGSLPTLVKSTKVLSMENMEKNKHINSLFPKSIKLSLSSVAYLAFHCVIIGLKERDPCSFPTC